MGGPEQARRYCCPVVTAAAPTNVIAPRRSVYRHLVELWSYRELLGNLVRKELKVRYKNSALGFAWSLLNPAMLMVVYTLIFQVVLKAQIPYFPIYLLSGLLAWNLFSTSLAAATSSITANPTLVNKVYFPREILPLAAVGANCVHFLLQATVLLATIAIAPVSYDWRWVWIVVPAIAVMLVLTAAVAIFLAAINVYARDTQHLLELLLLAWFWMTPILYQWRLPADKLAENDIPSWLVLLNPVTSITLAFQRGLYGQHFVPDDKGNPLSMLPLEGQWWYARNLGIVGVLSVAAFILAMRVFSRLEGNFAEEL
jgi:ABC-2 type transport system permease protein